MKSNTFLFALSVAPSCGLASVRANCGAGWRAGVTDGAVYLPSPHLQPTRGQPHVMSVKRCCLPGGGANK